MRKIQYSGFSELLGNKAKMAMNRARANVRLPPEVNRVLYVRNLPYKITAEEM